MLKRNLRRFTSLLILTTALIACEEEIDPDYELRDEYIGEWICNENSNLYGSSTYSVTISKSSDSIAYIEIQNFYNTGQSSVAIAEVFENSILIENQIMTTSTGSLEISGSGSANSDFTSFELVYQVKDGGETDQASAEFTRP